MRDTNSNVENIFRKNDTGVSWYRDWLSFIYDHGFIR